VEGLPSNHSARLAPVGEATLQAGVTDPGVHGSELAAHWQLIGFRGFGRGYPLLGCTRLLAERRVNQAHKGWNEGTKMKRYAIVLAAVPLASVMLAAPAQADPPVAHEPAGSAHTHHVHTGQGDCVDISSVLFMADHRGLHQGSNASQGPTQGPFHGTCDGLLYPGGPPVPFGPHH
jgi:hypothetical protein